MEERLRDATQVRPSHQYSRDYDEPVFTKKRKIRRKGTNDFDAYSTVSGKSGHKQSGRSTGVRSKPLSMMQQEREAASMVEIPRDMDTHSNLRSSQTAPPEAKTCYFYKENDYNYKPAKVVVGTQVKSWPVLLTELSKRVPLSFGVRSVATPGGHDMISNLDGLTHDGHYVCSTNRRKVKSLNLDMVRGGNKWNFGRPPSGQRALNYLLREEQENRSLKRPHFDTFSTRTSPHRDVTDPYIGSKHPKKITVMRNGDPTDRHVILLNRRTGQTFEQILSDMSEMFHFAIRKLYTMEGKRVRGCNSMFKGPEVLVCSGMEGFKKMGGLGYNPGSRAGLSRAGRSTLSRGSNDIIASRLKKRKERLTKTRGMWHVTVSTNPLKSAGTNAQVTLTIYGHRGNSGPITLGNMEGNDFAAGNKDEFNISIGNVGEIYKIRIGHDNTGDNPGWWCDEIRMKDVDTHEELVFPCRRWMARDEDDSEICREMAAVRRGEPILPVLRYEVQVITGNLWNSGTEANVYMTLYGDRGDTGVRQLYPGKRTSVFERGNIDTFYIEAVSLGHLRRLIIGHDGTSAGQGWFLEKIIVKEQGARDESLFYCGKWLDEGEDDGKIVRELKIQEEYIDDIIEKRNFEFEKWKFEKDCQIKLFSSVTEKAIRVKNGMTVDALADPADKTNIFTIVSKRAGMIRVLASVSYPNNYLAIDNSRVTLLSKPGAYTEFRVRVQDDRTIMFEAVKNALQFLTFNESGKIGDTRGILDKEPIRRFHVYCKGMFRKGGVIMLATSNVQAININEDGTLRATGKKTKLAQFRVHKVGSKLRMFESVANPGKYIRLKDGKIDCLGIRDDLAQFIIEKHPEKGYVSLQSNIQRGLYMGMKPDGRIWPTVDTGVNNIWLYPEVVEFGVPKSQSTDELEQGVQDYIKDKEETQELQQPLDSSRAVFLTEDVEHGKARDGDWSIQVSSLETLENADVAIVVYGDKGNSGPIILGAPPGKSIFVAGNNDEFRANLAKVGKISKIRLELIPKSYKKLPSWKVKEVKMTDLNTKDSLTFYFHRWLSREEEDLEIMREKPAKRAGEDSLPLTKYKLTTVTGNEQGSDTNAEVYVILYGEHGDTGRRVLIKSSRDNKFQCGQDDTFEIEAVSLGKLQKLIIGHDGTGAGEGWYLEKVIVKETEESVFQCDKWLDTSKEDRKIERTLLVKEPIMEEEDEQAKSVKKKEVEAVQEQQTQGPMSTYQVEVKTGSDAKGDANSNVYICIYGENGDSGKQTLSNSVTSRKPFQVGATDVFDLEVKDLGKVNKIVIGHDGKGVDSGWYLDGVNIIEKERKDNQSYYFPCDRWLDENVGDKKTEVELLPQKEPIKSGEKGAYKLWVKTAEDSKPANGGKVVFTMYGSKGKSDDITLFSANPTAKLFEPGNIDEFEVTVGDLGDIYKVRINREDTHKWQGWHLMELKMQDVGTSEEFVLNCDRWMARNKDDCDLSRELAFVVKDKPPSPMHTYEVTVFTGDHWAAETDANLYITIFGSQGDTGKRMLYNSTTNQVKYRTGQIDVFEFEAVALGDLTSVEIGHNSKGHGAGIFIDNVVVVERDGTKAFTQHVFPCRTWLDDREGDGKTWRNLPMLVTVNTADGTKQIKAGGKKTAGQVDLTVKTSNIPNAGTHANVYITAYGTKGKSSKLQLGTSDPASNAFDQGAETDLSVNFGDIGDLTKIRLEHDNSNPSPAWHVSWIRMVDSSTGEEHIFCFNQWLAVDEGDGEIMREVPAKVKKQKPLPVCQYVIAVHTGKQPSVSSIKGNVCIDLVGNHGNTGFRKLQKLISDSSSWTIGQEEIYMIEAVSVGKISNIGLQFEERGNDKQLYVEKVSILERLSAISQSVFNCNDWLDTGKQGGSIVEKQYSLSGIKPAVVPPSVITKWFKDIQPLNSQGKWSAWVFCGMENHGGTDEDVYLVICGMNGESQPIKINEKDKLNPSNVVKLDLSTGDIGAIIKIRLYFGDEYTGTPWYLQRVKLKDQDTGEEFNFECNKTLEGSDNNPTGKLELPAIRPDIEPLTDDEFTIYVATGNYDKADTEAELFCELVGDWGSSGKIMLTHSNNSVMFKKGQVDEFQVKSLELGEIHGVTIGHSEKGRGQGWFCERVVVKSKLSPLMKVFPCNRWLDTGCEDRQLVRKLKPVGNLPELGKQLPSEGKSKGVWNCSVITADKDQLPSSAIDRSSKSRAVSLVVYGDKGVTGPLELTNQNPELFLPGQTDLFSGLNLGGSGKIQKIRVCSVYEEDKESVWTVHKVILQDNDTDETLEFDFSRWVGEVGGDIRKELPVLQMGTGIKHVLPYFIEINTSDEEMNAGTDSNVFITLYGAMGDTGRRHLAKSLQNDKKFQTGKMDSFVVEAVDLDEIEKVVITKGVGDPWLLEKVVVKSGEFSATEHMFLHNKWIGSKDNKDTELEETLLLTSTNTSSVVVPLSVVKDLPASKGIWSIVTETGGEKGGQPLSDIVVVFSGSEGESSPLLLLSHQDKPFQIGQTDTCQVRLKDDIGELIKIRVGFKNNNTHKGWFLRKITFEDEDTHDTFTYELNDWILVDEKLDGWREFPVIWPAINVPPVYKYQVYVHIGDANKSTDGDYPHVSINISGTDGGSGTRSLKHSLANNSLFEANKVDQFVFEAVSLGDLQKLTISHEGKGCNFYLKKIVISESEESLKEFVFECNGWIGEGEGSELEKTLHVTPNKAVTYRKSMSDDVAIIVSKSDDESPPPKVLHKENSNLSGAATPAIILSPAPSPDHSKEEEQDTEETKDKQSEPDKTPTPVQKEQTQESVVQQTLETVKPPVIKGNPWKVKTTTGSETDQGTSSPVVLVLYGNKGQSEPVVIGESEDFKFTESKTDEFDIGIEENIGEVYKVRVGFKDAENEMSWYEGSTEAPSWFLEKMEITDVKSSKVYEFEAYQWIWFDGYNDFWREFPVKKPKKEDELSVLQYHIDVYTSNEPNAGTDANVFVQLFGDRGDTGRRRLLSSQSSTSKFEQGAVDQFEIEAVDLGKLEKVKVGHDGENPGSGWMLEKIVVKESESAKELYLFECNRWLDVEEDDLMIVRELLLTEVLQNPDDIKRPEPQKKEEIPPPTQRKEETEPGYLWKVTAKTGSDAGQRSGATVALVLYGNKGHEKVVIGEKEDFKFEEGHSDEFEIKVVPELGDLYKIRIGFDGDDLDWYRDLSKAPSWFVEKLIVKNMETNKEYVFDTKEWIKLDGVNDFWKEFPVKSDKPEEQIEEISYYVEAYTGDMDEAGTEANVFIQLYGDKGDSGPRRLLHSKTNDNKFEKGKCDEFEIKAVDLGKLRKVKVGHDGNEPGSGWFLQKVQVRTSENENKIFVFVCNNYVYHHRWLDIAEDDKVTEREIVLSNVVEKQERKLPKDGDYMVYVSTGPGQSTTSQVTLTVYGDAGNSGPLPLGKPNQGLFKPGQTDEFEVWVDPEELGEIRKIRIEQDVSGKAVDWKVEKVMMHNMVTGDKFEFEVNKTLSFNQKVDDIAVEIPAKHLHHVWPVNKYLVQTVTGKENEGGTDANVYINLFGTLGDSGKRYLMHSLVSENKFETGKLDAFIIEAVDLGRLEAVIIGHDGTGPQSAWFLDKVLVKESQTAKTRYLFPCGRWLKDDEDGVVDVELYLDRVENDDDEEENENNNNKNVEGQQTEEDDKQSHVQSKENSVVGDKMLSKENSVAESERQKQLSRTNSAVEPKTGPSKENSTVDNKPGESNQQSRQNSTIVQENQQNNEQQQQQQQQQSRENTNVQQSDKGNVQQQSRENSVVKNQTDDKHKNDEQETKEESKPSEQQEQSESKSQEQHEDDKPKTENTGENKQNEQEEQVNT